MLVAVMVVSDLIRLAEGGSASGSPDRKGMQAEVIQSALVRFSPD